MSAPMTLTAIQAKIKELEIRYELLCSKKKYAHQYKEVELREITDLSKALLDLNNKKNKLLPHSDVENTKIIWTLTHEKHPKHTCDWQSWVAKTPNNFHKESFSLLYTFVSEYFEINQTDWRIERSSPLNQFYRAPSLGIAIFGTKLWIKIEFESMAFALKNFTPAHFRAFFKELNFRFNALFRETEKADMEFEKKETNLELRRFHLRRYDESLFDGLITEHSVRRLLHKIIDDQRFSYRARGEKNNGSTGLSIAIRERYIFQFYNKFLENKNKDGNEIKKLYYEQQLRQGLSHWKCELRIEDKDAVKRIEGHILSHAEEWNEITTIAKFLKHESRYLKDELIDHIIAVASEPPLIGLDYLFEEDNPLLEKSKGSG